MSKELIGDPSKFIVWNGKSPDRGQFSRPPKIITRPGWQHTEKKRRLTLRESGLWTILMSYDYGGGEIFVSDKTLAEDAGIGEREVRKMRASMKGKGYLDWKPRAGTTNQYVLRAPDLTIHDRKHGQQAPVSNTDAVNNEPLDTVLDNPGPKVPGGRTKSSGVDRTNNSGGGRTKSSDEEHSSEEDFSEEDLQNNRSPLTPQGGNGGVPLTPNEQWLEEEAQKLLAYFIDCYENGLDRPYSKRKGTKDLDEFKDLLRQGFHPNDIQACIDEFVDDDDPTLIRKKSIAMFRARFNTYMQEDEEEY